MCFFEPADLDPVAAVGEHVLHPLLRLHQLALLVDDDAAQRLGQRRPCRCRAAISPVSSLSRVVLPAPFGPTTPIRSPRWMRSEKSRMIGRSPKLFADLLGVDHRLRANVVLGERELRRARGAEHRRPLRAHLVQLGEPPLVAPAPRGDSALQPVQLELELGVELLGRARFLFVDALGPRLEAAEADLGAPQLRRGRARGSCASAASGRCGRG